MGSEETRGASPGWISCWLISGHRSCDVMATIDWSGLGDKGGVNGISVQAVLGPWWIGHASAEVRDRSWGKDGRENDRNIADKKRGRVDGRNKLYLCSARTAHVGRILTKGTQWLKQCTCTRLICGKQAVTQLVTSDDPSKLII